MSAVPELREVLARRFPDAMPLVYRTAHAVATGIVELDGLLPNGGLPRGRLSVWKPGGGSTAVLRAACEAVVRSGERSAWVDSAGTMTGDHWKAGPLLVRPAVEADGLECAEELARCGGFGLVVVSQARISDTLAVRLSRAVRSGGGALVLMASESSQAQLRLVSSLVIRRMEWRRGPFGEPVEMESVRVRVDATSLGWSGASEFRLPVLSHRSRLAMDPLLVDRRGAPRRAVWPNVSNSRSSIYSNGR